MTTVYITNASLKKIAKSLKNKIKNESLVDMSNELIDYDELAGVVGCEDIREVFNNQEIKELFTMLRVTRELPKIVKEVKGNKDFITQYINQQNRRFLTPVQAPAYHHEKQCKALLSNFYNIQIPEECLEKKEEIQAWVNKHKNLSFEELNKKFKMEFNCQNSLEQIERKNSGVTDFQNMTLDELVTQGIVKKYTQLRFFFNHEFADAIRKFRYMPHYRLDEFLKTDKNKHIHSEIYEFHQVKKELKNMLINFYITKENPDISFDQDLLDLIGFRTCIRCEQENQSYLQAA